MTFGFWYKLSEDLYHANDDDRTVKFKPYIERLIGAVCRHCQIEPDHVTNYFSIQVLHFLMSATFYLTNRKAFWKTEMILLASVHAYPNWSRTWFLSSVRLLCSSTVFTAFMVRTIFHGR